MKQLRSFIDTYWFFPVIVLYYGLFYIFYGERTIINEGLGVDGLVYAEVAKGNLASGLINNYTVTRLLPACLVHLVMEIFSVPYSNANIISVFEAANLLLLLLSVHYLKKTFILLNINLRTQVLGFVLFLANIAVLKFSFYCPVGTDTDSLFLGIMLVYFYTSDNRTGVFLVSLAACFTWPFIAYQGAVMFLFPVDTSTNHPSARKIFLKLIRAGSVLFALFFLGYYVFYKKEDIEALFCLRIDKQWIYLSCLVVLFVFYHFAAPFMNRQLFYKLIKQLRSPAFYARLSIVVITLLSVGYTYNAMVVDTNPSQFLSLERMLSLSFLFSVVRPGFPIVAHFGYFALLVVLLIFFWKSFSKAISNHGVGIVLGFTMYLYVMGIMCETRLLTPLFPFLVIFLVKGINNFRFSNAFYILCGVLSVISSKIWLTMDYRASAGIDKDGCRDLPDQLLLMNFGPWMNELMYQVQGAVMIIFSILIFITLYRIEIKNNKVEFIPKFTKV
ncbi:MAG TPA: hypothetical protein VF868_15075 [Bacteroidia bacterium]|jgi:cell shape-determining protein MreD